jgi:hypothetical protein
METHDLRHESSYVIHVQPRQITCTGHSESLCDSVSLLLFLRYHELVKRLSADSSKAGRLRSSLPAVLGSDSTTRSFCRTFSRHSRRSVQRMDERSYEPAFRTSAWGREEKGSVFCKVRGNLSIEAPEFARVRYSSPCRQQHGLVIDDLTLLIVYARSRSHAGPVCKLSRARCSLTCRTEKW